MTNSDIIVVGSGLNGLILTHALLYHGWKVALIDQAIPSFHEANQANSSSAKPVDERSTALSLGTCHFLKSMGAWDDVQAKAEPIFNIAIVEENPGDPVDPALIYHHDLVGHEPMGYNVENKHLVSCLWQAIHRQSDKLKCIFGHKVVGMTLSNHGLENTLTLESQKTISSPLVVAADGRFSTLRDLARLSARVHDYRQSALVTHFYHDRSHQHWAFEIFYPHGPLAFLPAYSGHPSRFRSSLIWSDRPEFLKYLLKQSDQDFVTHLQHRLQERLGNIITVESRKVYGLQRILASSATGNRLVLLGDAAHALHPIAGQGLNLGVRDSIALIDRINHARHLGLDYGSNHILNQYEQQRQADTLSMSAMTHGLNQFFRRRNKILQFFRHTGMNMINRTPLIKKHLVYHAMGLIS